MRVRLESIGCRLNTGEIESLARSLASAGHRVVSSGEQADLCILNTCAVTSIASKKSRQLIRQIRRSNPNAAVVATGCDVELVPEAAVEAGVDLVVGNADKERLLEIADAHGLLHEPDPDFDGTRLDSPAGCNLRTRAFLKVQDGCDNRCTFCVTTIARGPGRSVPTSRLLDEVRELVKSGYREVVLSGVHLGSYGHDIGDHRGLKGLIEAILTATEIPRLRLSSLEPWDLDTDFFEVFADPHLLPHMHLPLQSGCDQTLKRMARRSSRREYSQLVSDARRACPDMAVSTDVIVGFPGESDQEFEQSISFVEEMAFSRLHIFRYSPRDGTLAATMPAQVGGPVAQERSRRMHALGAELEQSFNSNLVGRTLGVLWETAEDLGDALRWSGLTPTYVRTAAMTPTDEDLSNRVTPTEIVEAVPGGLVGRILSS
ncbi:MAG: tRNA (N(6)-L-threonylcarbamoyladenosine(37)-C(2))-methylthiotransferase MtaB [Candidatus Aminicenantes bacterium]|nr:MAG: tRNA (N(6)-L-threonylcarbamoyladenosine(37)-C(2))-methylthiotransferase MtaB [Candidatus Aminicenantes bacterium]